MPAAIQNLSIPGFVLAVLTLCGCEGARTDSPDASSASRSGSAASASSSNKFKVAATAFPDEWFFYQKARSPALRELEGKPAAELKVKDWIGEPQTLSDLKGKIVVVDFWATWCGPCMRSLPHNIDMVDKYKDKGVVFIGVHNANSGFEKMPTVAKNSNINYPLAVDDGGDSARAYHVTFWPTYVVIDTDGTIRGAGLDPDFVDDAIDKVLAEKG